MTRVRERGSAMLVTMVLIAALLAGAAVLASMQMTSNRSTELTRHGLASLYCAEAGLTLARRHIISNFDVWNPALAAGAVQPSWLASPTVDHDLDDDGADDFIVYLRDDDDETGALDPTVDINMRVFIVSRCIKYPDTPKQIEELIEYRPAMNPYETQEGGVNSRNNASR